MSKEIVTFSLFLFAWVVWVLLYLALVAGIIYAIVHFVLKFW